MAGKRSFERGEDYFASGQVGSLERHASAITARVQGTRPYRVKLWVDDGELEYSCTCPVAADGAFCKHCVAVGLASAGEGQTEKPPGRTHAKPAVTLDDVRADLARQDKNALVEPVKTSPGLVCADVPRGAAVAGGRGYVRKKGGRPRSFRMRVA
jgi:uncharacterized Zn finger protein